jgi:uncharacterized protein
MRKIAIVLGLALALCASQACAAPTQRQLELARRYIAASHMSDNIESMMKAMRPMLIEQSGQKLTPEQTRIFNEAMDASYKRFLDNYLGRVAPVLADIFSENELVEMVAFYESSTGQALLAKSPRLQAQIVPLVSELMPGFQADLSSEISARVAAAGR